MTQTKPRMPTKDELEQLDPEIRKKKLLQPKQKIFKWTKNDKVAYHALLEASEGNATVNIIILDCGYLKLYEELKKRFNITQQNVIQAKLAGFNLLTIKSGEKAVDLMCNAMLHIQS